METVMYTDDYMVEQVEYILAVGPSRNLFNRLVDEGAMGDEGFLITGDDLAGLCHAVSQIAEHFGVDWRNK